MGFKIWRNRDQRALKLKSNYLGWFLVFRPKLHFLRSCVLFSVPFYSFFGVLFLLPSEGLHTNSQGSRHVAVLITATEQIFVIEQNGNCL